MEAAPAWYCSAALSLGNPNLARTNFFYARVLRTDGDYDGALQHLQKAAAQYPRDRVVRNEMGRILFLQHKYSEAMVQLRETLSHRSRRPTGELQHDALLATASADLQQSGRISEALPSLQGGRVGADHYRPVSPLAS